MCPVRVWIDVHVKARQQKHFAVKISLNVTVPVEVEICGLNVLGVFRKFGMSRACLLFSRRAAVGVVATKMLCLAPLQVLYLSDTFFLTVFGQHHWGPPRTLTPAVF